MLASDETQRALRHVASSPELLAAIAQQTTGLAEEVAGGGARLRGAARRPGLQRVVRLTSANRATDIRRYRDPRDRARDRRSRDPRPLHVRWSAPSVPRGVARRGVLAPGLARRGLAGGPARRLRRHPPCSLLPGPRRGRHQGCGRSAYAGATPKGESLSITRSLVRLVGLGLLIVPMCAGFVPVLFTERRRGLPYFLAGTVVLYDDTLAKNAADLIAGRDRHTTRGVTHSNGVASARQRRHLRSDISQWRFARSEPHELSDAALTSRAKASSIPSSWRLFGRARGAC